MSEAVDESRDPSSTVLRDGLAPIEDVVAAVRRGEIIVLVDEATDGPGVLAVPAEKVTIDQVAFMIRRGGGIISVPLLRSRLEELQVPLMVPVEKNSDRTPFTIAVDAKDGISTGISASDRWRTIQVLIDEDSKPDDLTRPGHIYPLKYTAGGVIRRAGYTEAAVDLTKAAGLYPAAVLVDAMNDAGALVLSGDIVDFAREHGFAVCRIADVTAFRLHTEKLVVRSFETQISRKGQRYTAIGFESLVDDEEHLALVLGDIGAGEDVLVRVHYECLAGDVFGADECQCSRELNQSQERIREAGKGVLLYMRAPRPDTGGLKQLMVHRPGYQDRDTDSLDVGHHAKSRDQGIAAQVLHDLGVRTMWLLTDDPTEARGIEGHELSILGFTSPTDTDSHQTPQSP